jgi:ammonia channel protein AmtB
MIIFFHEKDGLFFTDIYSIVSDLRLANIIKVFGANVLGGMCVVVWTAVWAMPYFIIIKKCCLRVTKVDEMIGLDVAQYILGNEPVENFV